MPNEFRPGHPIVFWVSILALTFVIFSGAKAAVTVDDCRGHGSGPHADDKHWVIFPPKWVCTDGSIELLD